MPFTILCVDDHPDCRLSFALLLRQAGYSVREAANGTDALRFAPQVDVVTPRLTTIRSGSSAISWPSSEICSSSHCWMVYWSAR